MNSLLSEVYGNQTHTNEDLSKEANLQFFAQLCEHHAIDCEKLSEPEIADLFKVAMDLKQAAEEESAKEEAKEEGGKKNLAPPFGKHEAGESKEKEDKEEKKKEAAVAEWNEKRAAHVKVAEADATGRIMAHALVDELRKIAAAQEAEASAPNPAEKAASVIAAAQAKTAAATPTTNSATPNFDELAAVHAIDMLKQAGQDGDVAQARVSAVFTLGLQESAKTAAASTPDAALTLRALEFCEAAGYPVDWTKA
jgi:hypothetical protein